MVAPGASGAASVTASAESVELKPPPEVCAGGFSSVVPRTVVCVPPVSVTVSSEELRARMSAVAPPGEG